MVITKTQKFWLGSDFVLELLKQIPASVFWKDTNSVYLGCNDAFARSLGFSSPEEVIGKTDYDLPTTKEESDAFRADDKQVIESKRPKLNIEEYQTLSDGRTVTLLTNKVPLLDKQNNLLGILGTYYDITERKKKEEELREAKEEAANKTKTELLANMRRDIRTPLTGIIGFAQLIKEENADVTVIASIRKENRNYRLSIQPGQEIILTNREYTMLKYLSFGMSAKQIAVKLQLSNRTIEDYFKQLKNKFRCNNKYQLIETCMQLGITRQII